MRNGRLILLSTLGVLACSNKRLFVGDDGFGGGHAGNGNGGRQAAAGTGGAATSSGGAGPVLPSVSGGATGSGGGAGIGGAIGATGTAGASGRPGSGGAPVGSLSLLAGSIGGPGTADGTGAAARFFYPVSITSDGAGNLYVADSFNLTIRKVVAATGAVTTVAGRPHQIGAEDGPGAVAGFSDLKGITSDGAGNLYVVDSHTIRKVVSATGAVTTITDDTATPAYLAGPSGIASDGAGNLYVADTDPNTGTTDSTIRKVSLATGAITTFADRTGVSLHFDALNDVVSDRAGNLYVAGGGTIQKVVIATGALTTIAGAPGLWGPEDGIGSAARFGTKTSLALDGAGNLYVAESDLEYGGTIRKVVIATGVVATLAGMAGSYGCADGAGAAALFGLPKGIASDGADNLYVADHGNSTIRKVVVATRVVTTLAGLADLVKSTDGTGSEAHFDFPEGVASDGAGSLYVADSGVASIRQVVTASGVVTTLAGSGQLGSADGTGAAAMFHEPTGVASDGAGNLYVTDAGNNTIRKIVIATRAVTTLAGTANATDSAGSVDGLGTAARFNSPSGIASDGAAGNLYVTDARNNTIRKIVIATRAVTTVAGMAGKSGSVDGTGTAALFNYPSGIASDGAGNLYVADYGNSVIRKIVVASGAVSTLAGVAGQVGREDGVGAAAHFNYPHGIASDGAGHLYVADYDNGVIRKVSTDSAIVSTPIGTPGRFGVSLGALPASLNSPYGIVVLPTGELAIVDAFENAVLIGRL